jgi:hypothetical protein
MPCLRCNRKATCLCATSTWPRCTRAAAPRPPRAGHRALSLSGVATSCMRVARCTSKPIRTASTYLTGPGQTPMHSMDLTTTPRPWWHLPSRQCQARDCSRGTTQHARHCCRHFGNGVRHNSCPRCTCCLLQTQIWPPANRLVLCCAQACSSTGTTQSPRRKTHCTRRAGKGRILRGAVV